jgi:hypothetical protein
VSEENIAAHANDRKVRVFDEESVIKEEEEASTIGKIIPRRNLVFFYTNRKRLF